LGAPLAVAHVDEDQPAEVAPGVDPAVERYDLANMRRAQFIAMMRSFHLTVKPDVAGERRDFKDNSTRRPALGG
jgi:hypothetical protein